MTSRIEPAGPSRQTNLRFPLILLVFGVMFILVGSQIRPSHPADMVEVRGTIVEIVERRGGDGDRRYTPVYAYDASGENLRLTSSFSSGARPTVGSEVRIGYSAADPELAFRLDGAAAYFHWLFIGVGGLILLFGSRGLFSAIRG